MAGPLAGIKVLDLGLFIAGPCAGHVLAGLGADVIKVEPAGGDPFRHFGNSDYSPQFQAYNAGKRSVMLDYLKSEVDRTELRNLIKSADCLIENFRPGVLADLGLGWQTCRAINPRLVYCSISGFGETGPKSSAPCFDTVGQAASGFLSQMIDPAAPRLSGPAIADAVTGHYAAQAILAALVKRASDGCGAHIDIAMLDCMIHFSSEPFATMLATGRAPAFRDRVRLSQSFLLRCADDRLLALHLSSKQKLWDRLTEICDDAELASDGRFRTRTDRVANFDALEVRLGEIFWRRTSTDWAAALRAADLPYSIVCGLDEVEHDPQVEARRIFQTISTPSGPLRVIGGPWRFDGEDPITMSAPPKLNEHAWEVVNGAGGPGEPKYRGKV